MKNHFPFLMRAIAGAAVLLAALSAMLYCLFRPDWLLSCAITFGTTAYHFLMRLAVGYAIPRLTNYDFNCCHPWFQPRKWEPAFYRRLKLKRWKGRLPTYSPGQFSLRENSLHRVIQNMCGAELVHEIIMLLSFLPLLAIPLFGAWPVFLITSLLAALFDSIFVLAQRFNRPRLIKIYEKQEAKAHE